MQNEDIDMKALECRGDFWLMFETAMAQAGGCGDLKQISNLKFQEVVDVLAQNGIRMIYNRKWHIDSVGSPH